jgi:prepilin-type N-terminal cleavage/methylation domain-containing protein
MYKFKNIKSFSSDGFTLIELLVVIMILAVLAAMILVALDPLTQINKSKDAQRKQDLVQIRNALDTFYNDYNYYPQTIPFGTQWAVGNSVYMKKVPQDPDCYTIGYCYVYQTDTTPGVFPQWNVLYAHLSVKNFKLTDLATFCPLKTACSNSHLSQSSLYNYCILSGSVSGSGCDYINNPVNALPVGPIVITPPAQVDQPAQSGVDCTLNGYYAMSGYNCNKIGSPKTRCTLYVGDVPNSVVCYSAGEITNADGSKSCSGPACKE